MAEVVRTLKTLPGARPGGLGQLAGLAAFGGATAAAAAYGAAAMKPVSRAWYRTQRKPPFNPPDAIFGPVWSVLYALIAGSGWRVWRERAASGRSRALALWGAQLGLNAAWTRLFFGRRRPKAALVDLAVLDGLITAYALSARKVDRPAAWMVAPYLAWSAFALVLNAEIVRRNA